MQEINAIADVGSGGGFPGLPLKIKFPHLSVVLIEVNHKKVEFLETIVRKLKLDNVTISDLDWRTFLRTTSFPIDLFVSRASLHTDELVRLFKPGCIYNSSRLVYWASQEWEAGKKEIPYVKSEYSYTLGMKKRKYVLLGLPEKSSS
jgi:16S rRNA (guanine527-N7)-methyltransferase